MMNEESQASMVIKNDNDVEFTNENVKPESQGVFVSRTKNGLISDDEHGKEISSIFDILEPGDQINHQTVTKVDSNSITLDYFGSESVIGSEQEIFSVLIKEEIENWKDMLSKLDLTKLFELEGEDTAQLFRALELICMSVNMEKVSAIYPINNDPINLMILAMISGTIRKPIVNSQEDLNGKNVIVIGLDYNKEEIESVKQTINSKNGNYLYTIALTNTSKDETAEDDKVILC